MTYLITLKKNDEVYFLESIPKNRIRYWTTSRKDALILSISTESLMAFINEYLLDLKEQIDVYGIRRTIAPKTTKK